MRQVTPGASERSFGIQVARLAGLPDEAVGRAKEILAGLEKGEGEKSGQKDLDPGKPKRLFPPLPRLKFELEEEKKPEALRSVVPKINPILRNSSCFNVLSRDLFRREWESSLPKIVFLHGLLGSSRNWRSVCKSLEGESHAFSLLICPIMANLSIPKIRRSRVWLATYPPLARRDGFGSVVLCGHSLGGRWRCVLLADYPESGRKT